MTSNHHVIVIGGGPAGCATATHLAQAGKSVLLLERAPVGRDKPCGEVFSPPVRGMLETLGVLGDVTAAGAHTVSGATVHCANGESFSGSYLAARARSRWAEQGGLCLERRVFDRLLWDNAVRAGVDARRGVSLRGVLRENDREGGKIVGVRTDVGDFFAPLVVGADGGRSRVAREMGVVRVYKHLQKTAVIAHFHLPAAYGKELPASPVEMHVAPGGVVCGFARGAGRGVNVTFEMHDDGGGIARAGKEGFARELLRQFPDVERRLSGATLDRVTTCGTFGHGTRTPIVDGALLVGDAATFVDPFTGEGVYFALRGAEQAAQAILTSLNRGDTSARALRGYADWRRRELAPKYLVCDIVQAVVHRRGLLEFMAGKFARRGHLADALISVTGDMATPYRFLSPQFLLPLLAA